MRKHFALRAEDNAVAVEDKLVLAADFIDVSDVRPVVGRSPGDHLFTWAALAVVVRRTVDVDQELGAVVGLPRHRTWRIPAVCADRPADPDACQREVRRTMAGREQALRVEPPTMRK